ncbi:hypothetical protein TNCV_4986021 [Trichonephila clavipes]|nr:hypothetical protein TNCV_4986021 [Trichonephila clavipes]
MYQLLVSRSRRTNSIYQKKIASKDDKISGHRISNVEILQSVLRFVSKDVMTEAAVEVRKLKNTSSDVAECGVLVDGMGTFIVKWLHRCSVN